MGRNSAADTKPLINIGEGILQSDMYWLTA